MAINKLNSESGIPSRRKFVWGLGILSVITAFGSFTRLPIYGKKNRLLNNPGAKGKTVKMLTQDGRLVEIDQSFLAAKGKKVSDAELQHWIKK
jgi:hypothetical protein